jgi:hypothetical protein
MKKLELRGFRAWLARNHGPVSEKTAATYTSLVRAFLRDEETARKLLTNPVLLQAQAVEYDATLARGSRSPFRAALRTFLAFHEITRPPPPRPADLPPHSEDPTALDAVYAKWRLAVDFPDQRNASQRAIYLRTGPLHPIAPALLALQRAGVKFTHLEDVKWGHVRRDGGKAEFSIARAHTRFFLPLETMRALSIWAGGGEPAPPDSPLVPAEAKSAISMSPRWMRKLAAEAEYAAKTGQGEDLRPSSLGRE